ncbi:probable diacylglycerol acyltransferase type 2b [Ustilago bromivora]|uniref:Diacylglycerol O-acyltransferase n=1 Tax=Ustilago bromivora TaxID=307758 RepID=A0A1K0GAC2_9BASI|nr:probable diacylglycerol acyltransferase type 2b [Ustilago bromivora]SYW75760.1 probable diacylglycerol acyltransferase type 2b [Ustilago bromivora]
MGPHHPASETAGQRAQVHDVDGLSIGPKEVLDGGLPSSSKEQSDSTKKENVIRFAPLSIPRSRRLQTLGVLFWALLLPICISLFFLLLSIPLTWPILIPYLIWILFIDTAPENGGRRFSSVRKLAVFRYFAEYFPISMIKTTNLPPDRPYIFGCHPHGILGVAAVANLATDATEFSESFPGITPHLLTLATNFTIPLFRDCLMAMGICSVSKRSCEAILKKGKGSAIAIVVGGASESLAAHPGTADLTLRRRLGFIKIAIRNGADLVPVFSFGENDVYEQLSNEQGTRIYALQKKFQALFGFTLPFFHGRGLFNYSIGLMPYRHPIVSVVGKPIHVKQNPNPTKEELERVQTLYIEELMNIWDTWKDAYAANRTKELAIVA